MQQNGLWQAVLGEIELSVSRGNFITWFKNTQLLQQTDDVVVIGVPNVFIKQQLQNKYRQLIMATLEKNGVHPEHIDYKIHQVVRSSEPETPKVAPQKNCRSYHSSAHVRTGRRAHHFPDPQLSPGAE